LNISNEEFQVMALQQLKDLTEGQKTLFAEQKALAEGQKEIRKDLARLEYRMEHEVINKIRALFDACEAHEDYFKRIFARLDNIEIDTRYLVARVTRLEQLAK